jgi:hypothetical protein
LFLLRVSAAAHGPSSGNAYYFIKLQITKENLHNEVSAEAAGSPLLEAVIQ